MFNFVKCEVYTKDTILLTVNTLMYYRIVDIRKAIYEVDEYVRVCTRRYVLWG